MAQTVSIGIFQGRLTLPKGRGVQFFPFEEWETEFPILKQLGFNETEFIFDRERYEENPLWKKGGIRRILRLMKDNGTTIKHICADYFMREPFHKSLPDKRRKNVKLFKDLLCKSKEIGAEDVEIPLLDNSSVKTKEDKEIVKEVLNECLDEAKKLKMDISLEADLPPNDFKTFLLEISSPNLKVTYDSGNSASLGYDSNEEIELLGTYFNNIHIKDRVRSGSTVALGTGSVNFEGLFISLKRNSYRGSVTLQPARGKDGQERETTAGHLRFLRSYLDKYLL